jgi:hypothetical protein
MIVPHDYGRARDRFRSAADRLQCQRYARTVASPGPGAQELTIDVARCGSPAAQRALVVSSGLHGVEGFFGSAVQNAWLEADAPDRIPEGTAVVLIHALNPHGFAHLRRTDHRNVDLNRNFLLPGEPYRGSPPLYAKLDPALNPPRPPARLDLFAFNAMTALLRYGRPALAHAIAGGQYDFPRGLFYGGEAPGELAAILRESMPAWLAGCSRVLHLDLHTGLGPWATCRLLPDDPLAPHQRELAAKLGVEVVEPDRVPSGYYRSRGSLGSWCRAAFGDRSYTFFVAEFGTYSGYAVVAALRRENQAHHHCAPDDPRRTESKQRLLEVFCPSSTRWRERCARHATQLIRAALTLA